jgi:DNA polymerase-3 subunit beta
MIAVAQKQLASAIALAAMPLERRNTIPVLSTLRCRAEGALEFQGTDLDITITATVPANDTDWRGQFVLPDPVAAAKAVKTVGADVVRFKPQDNKLEIEAGALVLSTATPAAETFPTTHCVSREAWGATLSPETIASLARVARAMSHEETRYYLNGILLHHVDGWNYRAVATDGHRLFILELALPDAQGELADIILPRKLIGILMKAAKGATAPLRLAVGTPAPTNEPSATERAAKPGDLTRARFSFLQADGLQASISTKLIDGTYPDYRRVVPSSAASPKHFTFNSAELRKAVQALSIGSQEVRAIKVILDDSGRTAKLARYVPDAFSGSIEIACEHDARGFEVGINGRYLLDAIDCAAGAETAFATADTASPILVRNPTDTHWTGVLMPMRV